MAKNESKPNLALRELNYRSFGRLAVTLYWHEQTNSVSIDLRDRGVNVGFVIEKCQAKDAFEHPYPYAYQRGLIGNTKENYDDAA